MDMNTALYPIINAVVREVLFRTVIYLAEFLIILYLIISDSYADALRLHIGFNDKTGVIILVENTTIGIYHSMLGPYGDIFTQNPQTIVLFDAIRENNILKCKNHFHAEPPFHGNFQLCGQILSKRGNSIFFDYSIRMNGDKGELLEQRRIGLEMSSQVCRAQLLSTVRTEDTGTGKRVVPERLQVESCNYVTR